ncbi:MAG: CDP-diacylglycerol diphosphatase [Deltaproteobacteria bacterium]|nr:CDP-diacylglycerol diphosphatase [Deltaproteobacteria bacterium]
MKYDEQNGFRLSFVFNRGIRSLVYCVLIFASILVTAPADAGGSRDALWEIVTNCLDPAISDYCQRCRWPRIESACPHDENCKKTTAVWAETQDYVVIRDHKMCGCPDGFVHGLALPRTRVTGVEDPNRPDGIWRFAWAAAQKKIGDESAIALVVNPARLRSQDQLHVHILRLEKDARQRLAKLPVSRLQDLDGVWRAAGQDAAKINLDDYGVLVTGHPDGGFMVRIEKGSPEWIYTEGNCR